MPDIDFGSGANTPTGDLFSGAITKLKGRVIPLESGETSGVYGAARTGNNLVAPDYFGGLRVFTNMFTQSNWGAQPNWDIFNAIPDLDKSGNLKQMRAGVPYRKLCGRPSKAGGNMVIDWSRSAGDTTVYEVLPYSEYGADRGTITNFQVLAGQKKAVFTYTPPADEANLWGFEVHWISNSGNGTCIQPVCAEGDLQGNFTTTEEFYPPYVAIWKYFSVIRDLQMGVANGGGSHASHGWADRTPSDNLYPSRAFKSATATIGGLVLTAQQTVAAPYYAAARTKVRLMEKLGAVFGMPKGPIQGYANKFLVGVNAPSGAGSHDISGPDANGDFIVTVTPPSTASTWGDLKNFIRNFNTSVDIWIAALGELGSGYAPGFSATTPLSVVAPVRMTGGTFPLNTEGHSFEMKVRLMNKLTAERGGDPCHFHWVAQAGVSDDYVDGACRFFKANANPNCKLILEISNEPWNTAPLYVDGNYQLAAVGMSSQAFGPSNVGTDLRSPVDNSEKGTLSAGFMYGLAHRQLVTFGIAEGILGDQVVRAVNGVFHQGGPNVTNFNRAFDTLGSAAYCDVYLTADYDYSPMGESNVGLNSGNRGQWATGIAYKAVTYVGISTARLDYFTDAATNKVYFTLRDHTSSTIAADLAAGNIAVASPENLHDIAMYGQTYSIDNAVRFADKLATFTNDKGLAPLWAAYEGGTTGFDTMFYDDPKYNRAFNGTTAERDAHRSLLIQFLIDYYHSPIKREAANFHASERMRRLLNADKSYFTEYAGSGGDPYPNENHSYMMMRDLEAGDDINQRFAGVRDAQTGKYYGYFIEQWATPTKAVPTIAGAFAANQTLTATLLTPYRHLTTGHAWYNGAGTNASKLQDGGSTYNTGANPPSAVYIKQFLTDAFGRRIEVVSGPAGV
jgi:hypothetical protein